MYLHSEDGKLVSRAKDGTNTIVVLEAEEEPEDGVSLTLYKVADTLLTPSAEALHPYIVEGGSKWDVPIFQDEQTGLVLVLQEVGKRYLDTSTPGTAVMSTQRSLDELEALVEKV